jgi:hypothetical protein
MTFSRVARPELPTSDLRAKCVRWLQRAMEQKARAIKMTENARRMRERAEEMMMLPRCSRGNLL